MKSWTRALGLLSILFLTVFWSVRTGGSARAGIAREVVNSGDNLTFDFRHSPHVGTFVLEVLPDSTRGQLNATLLDASGDWEYQVNWGDDQKDSKESGVAANGAVSLQHQYVEAGNFVVTVTLSKGKDVVMQTRRVTIDGLEVTGFIEEYMDPDGRWVVIPDGDVAWAEEQIRYTVTTRTTFGNPKITGIEMQCRPWDDENAEWRTFASVKENAPVIGKTGLGIWAVRPVVHISNGL